MVEHAVGIGSWQLDSDTRFIYDDWNLLAEVEMHNSSVSGRAKDAPAGVDGPYVRRSYLWGPDVSGTMQGAGGVGGLLAVRRHARGTKGPLSMWTAWDLNGNVIGLHQNTSRNALIANYEYDPFGKPLRVSEPEEDLNPFQFSTKYTDAETGLCYYGYRYYDAVRGRWLNRDPIEERGGVNLYGMVGNDAVCSWDYLGLDDHHWFMQLGGRGQMIVDQKFPKLCLNIDRYTTAIDGNNVDPRASGSPHKWVHNYAFHGVRYERVYQQVLDQSKTECQFLVNMYLLMQVTHRLLVMEQELRGFTSGRYDAKDLDLHPYRREGSTHGECLLLIALHCLSDERSILPTVRELDNQTRELERIVDLHRLFPYPVFKPKPPTICGDCYPGARNSHTGPPREITPVEYGVLLVGGGITLGAVALFNPVPGDEAAALPVSAGMVSEGAKLISIGYLLSR